jgi:hypothetical protein
MVVFVLLNACAPQARTPAPPARPADMPPAPPQDSVLRAASPAPAVQADCPAGGAFPPLFAGMRAGINAFLLYTDIERATALIQHADFAWVRQQIHWRDIEIGLGRYDWSVLD